MLIEAPERSFSATVIINYKYRQRSRQTYSHSSIFTVLM